MNDAKEKTAKLTDFLAKKLKEQNFDFFDASNKYDIEQLEEIVSVGETIPVDGEDILERVRELLVERMEEEEVIYYADAMEYLKENDQSLAKSLDLAMEMGFTLENINSCTLATLLQQQENMEEIQEFTENIEAEFNDLCSLINTQ